MEIFVWCAIKYLARDFLCNLAERDNNFFSIQKFENITIG